VYKAKITQILDEIKTVANGRVVELMAVSKTHPYTAVLEAVKVGQLLFGENRIQEIEAKYPAGRSGFSLHMIGHLQSNKVKRALSLVDSIDSLDSLKLARRISDYSLEIGKVMPVLLEINTSQESAKAGFKSEREYYELLEEAHNLKGIEIRGLMTMGPLGGDEKRCREAFARLRELAAVSKTKYPHLSFATLSMGMSGDYLWAIKEGSTQILLGTAIFGRHAAK